MGVCGGAAAWKLGDGGRNGKQGVHRHGGGTRCTEVEIRFKLSLSLEVLEEGQDARGTCLAFW